MPWMEASAVTRMNLALTHSLRLNVTSWPTKMRRPTALVGVVPLMVMRTLSVATWKVTNSVSAWSVPMALEATAVLLMVVAVRCAAPWVGLSEFGWLVTKRDVFIGCFLG